MVALSLAFFNLYSKPGSAILTPIMRGLSLVG